MTEENKRVADYEIDPVYIKRWSTRAFSNKEVDEELLFSLFEAARWAPSAANVQPWRFVFARSQEDREKFLSFMNKGNMWCGEAPVLVAVISHKHWNYDSDSINPTHAFDTGTAWGFLALEAVRKGLYTHPMGGFDREKAREVLKLPQDYEIHAIVAVGYKGDRADLPEALQEREVASGRKGIKEFISEGKFSE